MKERVDSLDRKKLTHLMSLSAESPMAWTDAELAQILRNYLKTLNLCNRLYHSSAHAN